MTGLREDIDPFFMYGTAWKEENTEKLTQMALHAGFRAIDTANQRKHYHEEGVGQGMEKFLADSDISREDVFIQTKFTYEEGQDHRLPYDEHAAPADKVRQSMQSSLKHLQTDYIDSYILHGPSTRVGLSSRDHEVWRAMEDLQKQGLTHHIGVSNITAEQLRKLLDFKEIKPAFVQNRSYASRGWDKEVRSICKAEDIIYQGFSLLTANRSALSHPKVSQIAKKHELSISGLIFSFARQVGMLPLTGTTQKSHMELDLSEFNTELRKEEIETIENIAF